MPITSEIAPIEINSLGELVSFVTQTMRSDNRVRWFRGHREASWGVRPSIWRDYGPDDERNLTNRFRVRAANRRPIAPPENDYAAWLSLMQHYGLPTRLLDWTRSPLIACYFAVAEYRRKDRIPSDAAIWMLDPHAMNKKFHNCDLTFPIDSNTSRTMLEPAFKERDRDEGDVLAVMAVEHDLRLFVQQGAFTIHSSRDEINTRREHSNYLTPLLIPSASVEDMAWEILACGFRRGDLFPDLMNLADELKGTP